MSLSANKPQPTQNKSEDAVAAEKPAKTLRDELAMDRTRMANQRTLLSFVRTGLYFLVTGLALLKIEFLSPIQNISFGFFGVGGIIILFGIINFFRMRKKIDRHYEFCED